MKLAHDVIISAAKSDPQNVSLEFQQTIFKIFSLPFDVDCEKVTLQLQMDFIELQCLENFKSNFLACHILDFYLLLSG